eukprot:TRINITY_DN14463_c0_g1_i1.p1 TRINITY_DN14463_c0_g1~~TRINITY_DN14463_c0_g1_i1.p1  ORF type:complete len:202 (+),score=67.46 TRINITY_DN14463_c0_g1_i1:259-864(+)
MDPSQSFDFISASPTSSQGSEVFSPELPSFDAFSAPEQSLPFGGETGSIGSNAFETSSFAAETSSVSSAGSVASEVSPLDAFTSAPAPVATQTAAPATVFPEFKKLQDNRLAEVAEREKKAAQVVQERKTAATETKKQMLAERTKATEARKAKNRQDEKEFIAQRDATLAAGQDWQRVSNLLDTNAKTESTRMREVLLKLK